MIEPSDEVVARRLPSGLHARLQIVSSCGRSRSTTPPRCTSRISAFAARGREAHAIGAEYGPEESVPASSLPSIPRRMHLSYAQQLNSRPIWVVAAVLLVAFGLVVATWPAVRTGRGELRDWRGVMVLALLVALPWICWPQGVAARAVAALVCCASWCQSSSMLACPATLRATARWANGWSSSLIHSFWSRG